MKASLPSGWAIATLGEVGRLHCGQSPPAAGVNRIGQGVPYVSGPDQWTGQRLLLEKWTTNPKRLAPEHSIFITVKGAGVGTTFPGTKSAIGRDIYAFEPAGAFDLSFVHLAVDYDIQSIVGRAAGLIPGLSKDDLLKQVIPIPPFAEQKRIVERVEALLAQVQAARDRLERVQQILKRFRQAVLAAAFDAARVREAKEFRLGDLTTKIGSGATPRGGSGVYAAKGVPFIRSMNVRFEEFTEQGLAFLTTAQAKELDNVKTESHDVLLNITGASIGRACLLPEALVGARVSQHVAILRAKPEKLLPEFLRLYLCSPRVQSRINSEEYGVTRQALTKGWLSELEIPLPTLDAQRETVLSTNALLGLGRTLASRVGEGQRWSEMLPQAILGKAFAGELVPTEAELARAEGRGYESGEELLERVRGEVKHQERSAGRGRRARRQR